MRHHVPVVLSRTCTRTGKVAVGILLAGMFGVAATPATAQDSGGPPKAVALSAGWTFAPDSADRGLRDGWSAGRGSPAWRKTSVPDVFDGQPVEQEFGGTVGWYRTTFTGPSTAGGMRWGVRFEQARRVADVWLNGRKLGRHTDPYVPLTCRPPACAPVDATRSSSVSTTARARSRARAGGTGAG